MFDNLPGKRFRWEIRTPYDHELQQLQERVKQLSGSLLLTPEARQVLINHGNARIQRLKGLQEHARTRISGAYNSAVKDGKSGLSRRDL